MRAGSFARQVRLLGAKAIAESEKSRKKITAEVMGQVILGSPIDTGRFAGNWRVSEGSPDSGTIERFGTDVVMGEVQRAVSGSKGDGSMWLVNNLPYAAPIESGHSQQAPNGVIAPVMARLPAIIRMALNSKGQ